MQMLMELLETPTKSVFLGRTLVIVLNITLMLLRSCSLDTSPIQSIGSVDLYQAWNDSIISKTRRKVVKEHFGGVKVLSVPFPVIPLFQHIHHLCWKYPKHPRFLVENRGHQDQN
jgi:hypothetical protein